MTSNELAEIGADLPTRAVATQAGSAVDLLMQHAQVMDTAHQLASAMCNTSMVPAIYRGKPDEGAAAILYGAELGLTPIQSLQNVFPVHGMPSIYARTMVALLKKHGYRFETLEKTDEKVTVVGEAPDGTTEAATWTIERAIQAGYVPVRDEKTGDWKKNSNGKLLGNMKYISDPQAMLYAKAAAEVCRKLAPDVLLGIAYTYEDLEDAVIVDGDTGEIVQGKPKRRRGGRGIADLKAGLGITKTEPASEPAVPEPAPNQVVKPEPEQARAPQPEPEPEAATVVRETRPQAATRPQLQKLNILLDKEGFKDKQEKLDWLASQFYREFTSSTELTKAEASDLIEFLENAQAEDAAKREGQQ